MCFSIRPIWNRLTTIMFREFPYPYPCPLDALTMPSGSNYFILLNNMEHDLQWNSINMSYYGSHPLTILETGNIDIPGLEANSVINKDSLFQQKFRLSDMCALALPASSFLLPSVNFTGTELPIRSSMARFLKTPFARSRCESLNPFEQMCNTQFHLTNSLTQDIATISMQILVCDWRRGLMRI